MRRTLSTLRRSGGALAAGRRLRAACAGRPPGPAGREPARPRFPVTVGQLTLDKRPEQIVSLSPTATEMLFAIGAGAQVVAVDDHSNFPADAPKTDLSGLPAQRRGDRREEARPGGPLRRHRQDRRPARPR